MTKKGLLASSFAKRYEAETIQIFGSGDQRRDFNYVDDVVDALLIAGELESVHGNSYNLGHPQPESLTGFVNILGGLAEFETEYGSLPLSGGSH